MSRSLFGRFSDAVFWRPIASGLRKAGLLPAPVIDFRSAATGGLKVGDSGNRLMKSWSSLPVPIDAVLREGLQTTRARAREQALNNDYDVRFDSIVRSNVVGPNGIRLQMKLRTEDGALDRLANEAIERAWNEWSRPENCDVSGIESLVSLQGSYISSVRKDGEAIVRMYEGPGAGPFGFALRMLDPELLDVSYHADLSNGNRIRFGIEFNKRDRPVAFHFIDDPGSMASVLSVGYPSRGRDHVRIPADEIRHGFIRKHVGQKRGIPWSASALFRMKMLEGYEEAAVVAARVGAAKMGFIKSEDGRGIPAETDSKGAKRISAKPGSFDDLPPNTSLEAWNPTYPHEQFAAFVKSNLRGIASGLGVSYNVLANDLEGVNFSSIRTSILEDREVYRAMQRFVVDTFVRPVFDRWVVWAIGAGKVVDASGGRISLLDIDRVRMAATFVPRGWAWVDPLKDAKAATESINNGTGTISETIRERGRDPIEVFEEQELEKTIRNEKGLSSAAPSEKTVPEMLEEDRLENEEDDDE